MNGMKAKAKRLEQAKRFTRDGLPRDIKDWTEEDWRDLHRGIERIKARIAERHKEKR